MRWVLALLALCLVGAVPANPPGEDYSDPNLVNHYIWLECDALEYSYDVMRVELRALSLRYIGCISIQDNDELANMWYGLSCVFLSQTFDFRFTHIMSVQKAWNLMCNDEGRVEELYEIDF